ncbi:MAG: arylsulfatase [Flammeovirgaceae bacterium]|nr:arylsulfatase [Flammeovirgaceae bacterium]
MKKIQLLILLVIAAIWACNNTAQKQEETTVEKVVQKPNIIYMIVDDAGYGDFGCYGQEKFATPNIDKLAAGGMKFLSHYAGTTVCAPSRSSLMSGYHTGHTYIRGNKGFEPEGQEPIPDSVLTLAEIMQEAGYVTGGFGKWGLGGPGSQGVPENQGFNEWFGYNCQSLAHNFFPGHLWKNDQKIIMEGNLDGKSEQYSHAIIHKQALKFIDDQKDNSFFLFLPYTIPHAELIIPDDSVFAQFKGKYPETPYKGVDSGEKYRKGPYGSQEMPHAAFATMMTHLDNAVGDIMQKLEDHGIAENTIIMFTSDNGPHLEGGADPDFFNSNGIFQGYKRDLYEGGIRVPMIASWKGKIQPGSETPHISAFWDVLPTLAEIGGATVPEGIDGISFLPTLTKKGQQKEHDFLYWEFHEQGGKQAVRMKNWKGVRLGVLENPEAPIALYDLDNDPGEENNIAEQHPDITEKMSEIMAQEHVESEVFPFIAQQ